jgi:nucleoside-diphosphate-sugar epimerase
MESFPSMSPTILVIGGRSNALGTTLLNHLQSLQSRCKLVSLDLKSTELETEIPNVNSFVMNLDDEEMLKSVVQGCGVVVHTLEVGDDIGMDVGDNKKRVWDVNMGLTSGLVQGM